MSFLVRAAEHAEFDSDELAVLFSLITSGQGTFDYLMSKEGDEDWEAAQEHSDWDDREEWAKAEDYANSQEGNAAHFFDNPTRIVHPWCIHFTDSDPYKILKVGFTGHDFHGIGLTKMWKPGSHDGPYVFAYPLNDIKEMFKYGDSAIVFQAKEGLKAYHNGDEENQIIVTKDGIERMLVLEKDDDHEATLFDGRKKAMGTVTLSADPRIFGKALLKLIEKKK